MFKKAARFQTETRARRNQRETDEHAKNREAADALETTAKRNLTFSVSGERSSERIGVMKEQFEQVLAAVDRNSPAGVETIDLFVTTWNSSSDGDRLALVHIKCQLAKQGSIVDLKRGIARATAQQKA